MFPHQNHAQLLFFFLTPLKENLLNMNGNVIPNFLKISLLLHRISLRWFKIDQIFLQTENILL